MDTLPTRFDCRPIAIEILEVLEKYNLSYWNFNAVLDAVKQEVYVSTKIRIDPEIGKIQDTDELADVIKEIFPEILKKKIF